MVDGFVVSCGGLGTLFVVLGIPLVAGRIPPNRLYGFRTPRTLADEDVWYPANRISGVDLIVAGVFTAVLGLVFGFLLPPFAPGGRELEWTLALVGPITIAVIHSFWKVSVFVAELDRRRGS